jgi:hypothetical protein
MRFEEASQGRAGRPVVECANHQDDRRSVCVAVMLSRAGKNANRLTAEARMVYDGAYKSESQLAQTYRHDSPIVNLDARQRHSGMTDPQRHEVRP